jgi:hypothetical protein
MSKLTGDGSPDGDPGLIQGRHFEVHYGTRSIGVYFHGEEVRLANEGVSFPRIGEVKLRGREVEFSINGMQFRGHMTAGGDIVGTAWVSIKRINQVVLFIAEKEA